MLTLGNRDDADQVWIILHGYGMLARGMLHWFRHAARPGRLLVAPEALSRFYTDLGQGRRAVGASWVTREELSHDVEDNHRYLERVVDEFAAKSARLHVHGFSQGVSVALRWAARTSRNVDRIVCWAGAAPEDVATGGLQRALGGNPLHLVVGSHDARVPPDRVAADAQRFTEAGVPVQLHQFDGGHTVDPSVLASFARD